jgi:hypothetical protein
LYNEYKYYYIYRLERAVDEEKHVKEKLERENMDLVQKIEVGQRYVMSKPGLRYRKKEAKSRRNPINDNVYLTWKFNIGGIPSNLYIKLHK